MGLPLDLASEKRRIEKLKERKKMNDSWKKDARTDSAARAQRSLETRLKKKQKEKCHSKT